MSTNLTSVEHLYGRQSGPATVPSRDERELSPEWTQTDPQTNQWVCEAFPKRYVVYEGDHDHVTAWRPQEMSKAELQHAIDGYYEDLTEVKSAHGDIWPRIVAEILSEKHVAQRSNRP